MEHGAVGGVHLILAVDTARRDDADGQRPGLHGVDLHGRGLGAQEDLAVRGEIEGVRPLPGGVPLVDVQLGEVILLPLHLRAVHDLKAHADEDVLDLIQDVVHGVLVPQLGLPAGQGHVDGLPLQLLLQHGLGHDLPPLLQQALDLAADLVGQLTHHRALLRGELAHLPQDRGHLALFAQVLDAQLLQLFHVVRLEDGLHGLVPKRLHQFFHV